YRQCRVVPMWRGGVVHIDRGVWATCRESVKATLKGLEVAFTAFPENPAAVCRSGGRSLDAVVRPKPPSREDLTMTATIAAPAEALGAGRREWIGLAVLALPALLVSLDVFVLVLALPKLAVSLHADGTEQLWIMDIYGFMVA